MQSDQIGELAGALCLAQAEMVNPAKTKTVEILTKKGFKIKYNYADLPDVIKAIKPTFYKHGLAFSQRLINGGLGCLGIHTTIMHKSGQWTSGEISYPIGSINDLKEYGAAITYLRRYSLNSIVGLAPDDDTDCELGRPEHPLDRYTHILSKLESIYKADTLNFLGRVLEHAEKKRSKTEEVF